MVDFRYHVVSIVAVFLALAIGIVLGTTTLKGPVLTDVQRQVKNLRADNQNLRDQADAQARQLADDQALQEQIAPLVNARRLAGEQVAVVTMPGAADSLRKDLEAVVVQAGASVVADVKVNDSFVAPDHADDLAEVAAALPAGAVPSSAGLKSDATPAQRVGAALAAALVVRSDPTAADAVLDQLDQAGVIDERTPATSRATLALTLGGTGSSEAASPTPTAGAETAEQASLDVVAALSRMGSGQVVAGATGSELGGGLVAAVRSDRTLAKQVSTVDGAEAADGHMRVVWALRAAPSGVVGAYGHGPGTSPTLPTPSPSPTGVATTTASPRPS